MANMTIPVCPLMSAGSTIPLVCLQERCAWYMANLKKCAIGVLGHNQMLDIREKMTREGKNNG
ncbi:MAG: hypothetical protein LUE64_04970 [Candidatus Gastranaerophilales bacterium]|nr:hypothetical protein [Candidatus Gastranaerophilales bacterium]